MEESCIYNHPSYNANGFQADIIWLICACFGKTMLLITKFLRHFDLKTVERNSSELNVLKKLASLNKWLFSYKFVEILPNNLSHHANKVVENFEGWHEMTRKRDVFARSRHYYYKWHETWRVRKITLLLTPIRSDKKRKPPLHFALPGEITVIR